MFLGRLASEPDPFGAFVLSQLAKGTRPGPMVPIMPPFPVEEKDHPRSENEEQG